MSNTVKEEDKEYLEAGTRVVGSIPPLTFENMDTPMQRAHAWYARMGRPDRETMKNKVQHMIDVNHPHINISVEDVNVLPWNEAGVVKLSWAQQDAARRTREREEAAIQKQKELRAQFKERRKSARLKQQAMEERLRKIQEEKERRAEEERKALEAEDARNRLEKYCQKLKQRIWMDRALGRVSKEDKNTSEAAIDDVLHWLEDYHGVNLEEIEEKHQELAAMAKSIFAKTANAKEEESRLEARKAKKRLEEYCNNIETYKNLIEGEDKETLDKAINKTKKWLDGNPEAKKEDYTRTHKKLEEISDPILDKIRKRNAAAAKQKAEAEAAKKLFENFLNSSHHSLDWDSIPKDDRKILTDAIDDAWKWLRNNPKATKEQYETKLNEKEKELDMLASAIFERLHEEEEKRQKEKEAVDEAKKCLHDFLDGYPSSVIEWDCFIEDDKKAIMDAIGEGKKWMDSNPNAGKEQYETKLRQKQEELDGLTKSILKRLRQEEASEARKRLGDFLDNYPSLIIEWERFTRDDKKKIMDPIDEGWKWMDSNPNATKKQYETELKEKQEELGAITKFIVERLGQEEAAAAKKCFEDFLDNYPSLIIEWESFTDDDKKTILDAIDEGRKWMNLNPNAMKEHYESKFKEKQGELDALTKSIVERLRREAVTEAKNRLENFLDNYPSSIIEWDHFTDDDKKTIICAINEGKKWIDGNPNATREQYETKLKEKQEELDLLNKCILERLRHEEAAEAKQHLQDFLDNYPSSIIEWGRFTHDDKKAAMDGIDEGRKWMESNSNATKEEYETKLNEKQEELDELIKPILARLRQEEKRRQSLLIEKETAEARKRLKDFLDNYPSAIIEWERFTNEDKKTILDAIDEGRKWMDSNPSATKEQYETELKEKHEELDALTMPILERLTREEIAEAKKRLADFLDNYPSEISEWECLTDNDKKTIMDAIDQGRKWMDSNPDATKGQYENKLKEKQEELHSLTKPILERLRQEGVAQAKKCLEEFLDGYPSSIIEWKRFTHDDKKTIMGAIDKGRTWINSNPNATKEQYETKLKEMKVELDELTTSIVERLRQEEAAEARKRLGDFLDNYPSSVIEWKRFTRDDKKTIVDAIDEGRKWMDSNPDAVKEQYATKLKEKQEELSTLTKPILKRLQQEEVCREKLQKEKDEKEKIEREAKERAAKARRARDEQKRAEKEKRLKELEARRKLIEQIEADALERELTAEEKMIVAQFYETRKLIAYNWWGRLNRPFRKKMIKMVETLDSMKYANIKPKDIDLLPWLGDGFVVDVGLMSGLISNLDSSVVEQVDRWM